MAYRVSRFIIHMLRHVSCVVCNLFIFHVLCVMWHVMMSHLSYPLSYVMCLVSCHVSYEMFHNMCDVSGYVSFSCVIICANYRVSCVMCHESYVM